MSPMYGLRLGKCIWSLKHCHIVLHFLSNHYYTKYNYYDNITQLKLVLYTHYAYIKMEQPCHIIFVVSMGCRKSMQVGKVLRSTLFGTIYLSCTEIIFLVNVC